MIEILIDNNVTNIKTNDINVIANKQIKGDEIDGRNNKSF